MTLARHSPTAPAAPQLAKGDLERVVGLRRDELAAASGAPDGQMHRRSAGSSDVEIARLVEPMAALCFMPEPTATSVWVDVSESRKIEL